MYPVAYPMAKPPHTVWQTLLATSYYVMLRHQETMAKDVCRWRGGHYVRGPTAERNDEHHQAQEQGLHSSTFQLNLSGCCGSRGCI